LKKIGVAAQTVQVRKASAEDAAAILACLAVAFEQYRDQYTVPAFADTVLDADAVQRRLGDMTVFVAIADRKTVGTIGCGVNGTEGHIRGMAVLPEWQGMGVAFELLRSAEAELVNRSCRRVTLDTTQPLERAIRFYEKHGFTATGRVFDFFGMPLYEYSKSLIVVER
jgi:ribosomal protein S18 acetylase RimI-like enzyme